MLRSTLNFNREILIGEIGALLVANVSAPLVSRLTRNAAIISSTAVIGTLLGGALFWLAARVYDQVKGGTFSVKATASDVGYFTPAAVLLGIFVYDPLIYVTSHRLLEAGGGVIYSVFVGQLVAFVLFLLCLNIYRYALIRLRQKTL